MSAPARSQRETPERELEQAAQRLRENAQKFVDLPIGARIALLEDVMDRLVGEARHWVVSGCKAKGIDPDRPIAGEEWLAGPLPTMRNARLLVASLRAIAASGRPTLGTGTRMRPDGRLEVQVAPTSLIDRALFTGFAVHCLMEPGMDAARAAERQAPFYRAASGRGRVCLVLGAGNVSSIPPMDVFHRLFNEGAVCILKMNPVNEWLGPHLEKVLEPLIRPGYLAIVYGGAEAGTYLVNHPAIDEIHITGSDRTHDLIVWGKASAESAERRRNGKPLLAKRITSELGNISPVAIVPGEYTARELSFQAKNVASMVANNGSFNCNAGKMLITSKAWKQRATFIDLVRKELGSIPVREAYYPGAKERYQQLLEGRAGVETFGTASGKTLAWALATGLDPGKSDDPAFRLEPFCGLMYEMGLDAADPAEFLGAATRFMNDQLWGTLNAALVIDPRTERKSHVATALDRAILELRYGTVAINHWPALSYGLASPPWGGHPSATLGDIQSGLGWVHNTYMLEGVEKVVLRGPIALWPKPLWFHDNRACRSIGAKITLLERRPGWLGIPSIALDAVSG